VSAPPRPTPPRYAPLSVHGGPSTPGWSTDAWTQSTALSVEKLIPAEIPRHFVKKPLCFFEINPRSSFTDFALKRLCFSEINLRSMILQLGPKFEKYLQKGP
jgi:hypothetical protein